MEASVNTPIEMNFWMSNAGMDPPLDPHPIEIPLFIYDVDPT
jgi:hypothetical protein